MQDNNITTLSELSAKIVSMHSEVIAIREKMKPAERRLNKLNEHFAQVKIYQEYSALYEQYKNLNPKQQHAFFQQHHAALTQFDSAHKYLEVHLNGRKTIPLAKWQTEAAELTDELKGLRLKLDHQKEEVRKAETVQRTIAPSAPKGNRKDEKENRL